VTYEPEVPEPSATGDVLEPCPEPAPEGLNDTGVIARLVALFFGLPRRAQIGLLGAVLAILGHLTGADESVLRLLLATPDVEVHAPASADRSHRQDLRLERADGEALDGKRPR